MKTPLYKSVPLLVPLFAAAVLTSCVVPVETDGGHYASSGGHMVYTSLPTTFVGSAYYYDGRYYSGGHYQTGNYNYRGRPYNSRYYYNGKYFYGGSYQEHAARETRKDNRREQARRESRSSSSRTRSSASSSSEIQTTRPRY